jgi:low temperature requirement protein LtrA
MGILELILVLVVIGVVLWAVNAYVPMDSKIKKILNVVVVVVVVLWLVSIFFPGLWSGGDIPVRPLND